MLKKFIKKPWGPFPFKPIQKSRIYIIPTFHGLIFLGLILGCILVSATYGSNLVLLMALILLGVFLVTAILSNSYLKSLEVQKVEVTSNYLDQKIKVRVLIKNRSQERREGIVVELSKIIKNLEISFAVLESLELKSIFGTFEAAKRGRYELDRVKISTTRPLGLFYVWSLIPLSEEYYVYPRPEGAPFPKEFSDKKKGDLRIGHNQGLEDFYQHRTFREGEALGQVDWKALARGRPKMIKEFRSSQGLSWNINWDRLEDMGFEKKLSQLSLWFKVAQENKINIQFAHTNRGKIKMNKPSDYARGLSLLATMEDVDGEYKP